MAAPRSGAEARLIGWLEAEAQRQSELHAAHAGRPWGRDLPVRIEVDVNASLKMRVQRALPWQLRPGLGEPDGTLQGILRGTLHPVPICVRRKLLPEAA